MESQQLQEVVMQIVLIHQQLSVVHQATVIKLMLFKRHYNAISVLQQVMQQQMLVSQETQVIL